MLRNLGPLSDTLKPQHRPGLESEHFSLRDTEFCFLFFFKYLFLFISLTVLGLSCSMGDLLPWPGIEPRAPCIGSMEPQPLDHQGSPKTLSFKGDHLWGHSYWTLAPYCFNGANIKIIHFLNKGLAYDAFTLEETQVNMVETFIKL